MRLRMVQFFYILLSPICVNVSIEKNSKITDENIRKSTNLKVN